MNDVNRKDIAMVTKSGQIVLKARFKEKSKVINPFKYSRPTYQDVNDDCERSDTEYS